MGKPMTLLKVLAIVIGLLTAACSTTQFEVKSDPVTAEVSVLNEKNEKKPLGKTPLLMPDSEVKKILGDGVTPGEFFTVVVEKEGFVPQTFSIPASRFGTLVTSLTVKLKEGEAPQEARIAKEILDHLFLAQKLALAQQFERAQIELDKVITPFPKFSRALSMRASIYFAQKNYPESMKWYEEALKNDPQMEEAVKMLAKVRTLQGLPTTGIDAGKKGP